MSADQEEGLQPSYFEPWRQSAQGSVKAEVYGRNLEEVGRFVSQEDSLQPVISQGQVL